jgi:hypothetical protein
MAPSSAEKMTLVKPRILQVYQAAFSFLSVATLVYWCWLVVIPTVSYSKGYLKNPSMAAPNSGWPRWFLGVPVWYWYFSTFPVVYLLLSAINSAWRRRSKLIAVGMILHCGVVGWVIVGVHYSEFTLGLAPAITFAALWIGLCFIRTRHERIAIQQIVGPERRGRIL